MQAVGSRRRQWRRRFDRGTDLVVAHRLDAALAALDGAKGRVPVIVNFDDIEHVVKRRRVARSSLSLQTLLRIGELPAIKRAELGVVRSARRALVCSAGERSLLIGMGIATPVDVIPNAVRSARTNSAKASDGKTLMFIGSYGYYPNVEAAEELINRIFPRVLARVPTARLLIAGARSERLPSVRRLHPSIEILGFIDDVSSIYARADVACCAIRAGGGTRIKIIEAAAWEIPTVSTTLGSEGLTLRDGMEIVHAESAEALADACIALIENPERAKAMGSAARRRIESDHEYGGTVRSIVQSYVRTADFKSATDLVT